MISIQVFTKYDHFSGKVWFLLSDHRFKKILDQIFYEATGFYFAQNNPSADLNCNYNNLTLKNSKYYKKFIESIISIK